MDELTREFLIESQEGLDRMERCLTDLEQRPDDSALLAEIFRSVHTIKGTTGFLGYTRLERLAHCGENLLGLLRDGKLAASAPIITGLLQLLDGLRTILKAIETDGTEGPGADEELISRLDELRSPACPDHRTAEPPPSKIRKSARSRSAVRSLVACSTTAASLAPAPETIESPSPQSPPVVSALPPPELLQTATPRSDRLEEPTRPSAAESTLRVDVALLNRMMNLVGELVLTRNQVLQATASNPNFAHFSRRLDMVTADLREAVMKARMQPVSSVFSRMPRMVRDLSQALHRNVRLEMEGQETGLDKSLLEAIKDPLTHAVRNALDHGIEAPDIRHAAGKDPQGLLKLSAAQQGSHVLIEISDDGAGIAVEKVRDKAIERGLITAEIAAQQSERELLQLIFLPGFSTAAAVTNVSGRGVGMDVVRTNVEKIGGKVELDSNPGQGTTLRLRIPLTLAIIPALIVRSLGQSFALPQGSLSELIHVPPGKAGSMIEWIDSAPLFRLRGNLLPLVFLDRLLVPGNLHSRITSGDSFIAVLDADGRRFGLVVDDLADPEEIVVKPLNAALKGIHLYSGATVLGSGHLALILDPASIALKAGISLSEAPRAANEDDAALESSKPVEFLLVDLVGQPAAVPLTDVLRIAQIPASQIEYVAGRPVLNFAGELLPIDDPGGVLPSADNPAFQVVVVVCREGRRHVGIAVSHVLDVASGSDLFEAGTRQRSDGVIQLKNHVTRLLDLCCVQPLPATQATADPHIQFAEVLS
jgi:two-component system chemotaxis sensor kinase CheA